MLLVPEALRCFKVSVLYWATAEVYTYSVPAVEMCSLMSEAGVMISALLTL
jgi:hypothetical protein